MTAIRRVYGRRIPGAHDKVPPSQFNIGIGQSPLVALAFGFTVLGVTPSPSTIQQPFYHIFPCHNPRFAPYALTGISIDGLIKLIAPPAAPSDWTLTALTRML
jgi:hypothetical protein